MASSREIERMIVERLRVVEEALRVHAALEQERARLQRALRALRGEPATPPPRPGAGNPPCEARRRPSRMR
jgi:hypothetical protein